MFLHQEYLERNGIDIEWIGHPQKANLILRSSSPYRYRWVIVQIQMSGVDFHPKHYDLCYVVPRKCNPNMRGGNSPFSVKKQKIGWDQFDYTIRFWLNKAKRKFRILKERKERELALWEMFISTHDSILAKLPFETKKSLAISIDPRIFQEERYNSYRSVSDVLENRYSKILMMFHEKFLSPYLETIEFTNL